MAALPVVLVAAATVISTVGAITSSQASASAHKYEATIAEQNSNAALQQSAASEQMHREQALRTIGATTAAYGASGVTMEGTPLDVLANSAANAERDRQNILYKGQMEAAGYQDQAQMDRAAATNDLSQGYMKASATLLKGGGDAYGMKSPSKGNASYGMDEL